MDQYFYVVNLNKREFLRPRKFGEGLKLFEFGSSREGTLMALATLLASPVADERASGRWHGDRIKIAGDYANADLIEAIDTSSEDPKAEKWTDVSEIVIEDLRRKLSWWTPKKPW